MINFKRNGLFLATIEPPGLNVRLVGGQIRSVDDGCISTTIDRLDLLAYTIQTLHTSQALVLRRGLHGAPTTTESWPLQWMDPVEFRAQLMRFELARLADHYQIRNLDDLIGRTVEIVLEKLTWESDERDLTGRVQIAAIEISYKSLALSFVEPVQLGGQSVSVISASTYGDDPAGHWRVLPTVGVYLEYEGTTQGRKIATIAFRI